MRPHSLDVLEACLERLVEANLDWCEAARAHYELLLVSRLEPTALTMAAMEKALLAISEEEELRVEQSVALADALGVPSEPPPRLEALCAALPPDDGRKLSEIGGRLKPVLEEARIVAERIRAVAEIGWKTAEATATASRVLATRSARPPAAYVRGGRRTSGTAVPVYDRTWRA
jgi:hypothetical protein